MIKHLFRQSPHEGLVRIRFGYDEAFAMKYNQAPTWSVTVSTQSGSGGAMHDLALALEPKLAPIVKCHLRCTDGMDIHLRDNLVYFLQEAKKAIRTHAGSIMEAQAVKNLMAYISCKEAEAVAYNGLVETHEVGEIVDAVFPLMVESRKEDNERALAAMLALESEPYTGPRLGKWLGKNGIQVRHQRVPSRPDGLIMNAANNWRVELKGPNTCFSTYFSSGSANGPEFSLASFFSAIVQDALMVAEMDEEEFLVELGYADDAATMKKGKKAYKACLTTSVALKAMFGDLDELAEMVALEQVVANG